MTMHKTWRERYHHCCGYSTSDYSDWHDHLKECTKTDEETSE